VAWRYTGNGTHKGELQGIPPTGKRAVATGTLISRIVNGQFVEDWNALDALGMLQQLGVIPPMG
jgi:predicted ester cyclase